MVNERLHVLFNRGENLIISGLSEMKDYIRGKQVNIAALLGIIPSIIIFPCAVLASPMRVNILAQSGLVADQYDDIQFNPAYINEMENGFMFFDLTSSIDSSKLVNNTYGAGGSDWMRFTATSKTVNFSPGFGLFSRKGLVSFGIEYFGASVRTDTSSKNENLVAKTSTTSEYSSENIKPFKGRVVAGLFVTETVEIGVDGGDSINTIESINKTDGVKTVRMLDEYDNKYLVLGAAIAGKSASKYGAYLKWANDATRKTRNNYAPDSTDKMKWDSSGLGGGVTYETDPKMDVQLRSFLSFISYDKPMAPNNLFPGPDQKETRDDYREIYSSLGMGLGIRQGKAVLWVPSAVLTYNNIINNYRWNWDTSSTTSFRDYSRKTEYYNLAIKLGLETKLIKGLIVTRVSIIPLNWNINRSKDDDVDSSGLTVNKTVQTNYSYSFLKTFSTLGVSVNFSRDLTADFDLMNTGGSGNGFDYEYETSLQRTESNLRGFSLMSRLNYRFK